ncbi:Polyphosphate:ADP phosphotransferase [compost metagenome]
MAAYEEAIRETSTEKAPWYVIPADKKWYTRLATSQVIADTFKSLNLKYPQLPKAESDQLAVLKQQLLNEE